MSDSADDRPPLLAINGTATPEEVAAIVAVLQGLTADAAPDGPTRVRQAWSAPARSVRRPVRHGPDGWRTSSLPG